MFLPSLDLKKIQNKFKLWHPISVFKNDDHGKLYNHSSLEKEWSK